MLLAAPVLHDETEIVRIEEETLCVTRARRAQVDQEHRRKLEAFGRMDREQRDGVSGRGLLRRLSDRQLGVDDLVEVADKVADARQRELSLETRRQLKDFAQVQQRARAAISLRPQLG